MIWLVEVVESVIVGLANSFRKPRLPVLQPDKKEPNTLGVTTDGQGFSILPSDLEKHVHVVGSTGVGKSCLVLRLVELDILREHSIVVIDLRGDLVGAVVALCARLGIDPGRVTILDLRDKTCPVAFNPLTGAGEPFIKALHMLSILASSSPSWGVQVEEYCRNALLVLVASDRSLTEMEDLLHNVVFLLECLEQVHDESLVGFWLRYTELSKDKQRVIASSVLNKVSSLTCIDALKSVLGGPNPIDLEEILGRPGSIFLVSLAVDELHRSGAMLGSLIVAAISRTMLCRVEVSQANRNPVRLVVDEFEYMAGEAFEELIQEGRRFNCTCILSHQQYSQLPSKLKSLILANCGLRILFQLGFEDAKSVASELPPDIDVAKIRSLKTGQAIVMRRDGSAKQVSFFPPEKAPLSSLVQEFHTRVLARFKTSTDFPKPVAKQKTGVHPDLEDWL